MSTQIERNAQMVADLAISDWRMAYVIACSVRTGEHGGARRGSSAPGNLNDKVSVGEFSRMVKAAAGGRVYGVGDKGIRSSLDRWDSLYEGVKGWQRGDLTPEDANVEVEFPNESFRSLTDTGEGAKASTLRDVKANPALIIEALEDKAVAAKVKAQATPKARANMVDAAIPPIAPIVDDFRGGTSHDFLEDSVPSDDLSDARTIIARIKRKNEAGEMNWTLLNKGVWDQIVNMVASVTMTLDLSDVHALAESEK